MQIKLAFCLPVLLFAALITPVCFAADKYDVTANEVFDPGDILGTGGVGYPVTSPTVYCPGHEPTDDSMQPCPLGSRTHLRGTVLVSRVESTDPSMSGWMTVTLNGNFDANFEGPVWGLFSIAIDSGGTWEGTWQGLRVLEGGFWTATLQVEGRGFGGTVDGMKLMGTDEIFSPTPVPVAYFGFIQGRIVDPN